MPTLLTTADVAAQLGITAGRVRALIRSGRLPATLYGRVSLVREQDVALVAVRVAGWPKGRKRKKT